MERTKLSESLFAQVDEAGWVNLDEGNGHGRLSVTPEEIPALIAVLRANLKPLVEWEPGGEESPVVETVPSEEFEDVSQELKTQEFADRYLKPLIDRKFPLDRIVLEALHRISNPPQFLDDETNDLWPDPEDPEMCWHTSAPKWQEVTVDPKGAGHTYRLAVPGGWLYRTVTYRFPERHREWEEIVVRHEGDYDGATFEVQDRCANTKGMHNPSAWRRDAMEITQQTTVFVPSEA